jgi:hypothetical protein
VQGLVWQIVEGKWDTVQGLVWQIVEGKWDTGVLQKFKKPANSPNQHFYKVEYTLLDGSVKLVPLCGIHCCPGMCSQFLDET